ncbi:hypothetical protein M569_03678 [Genlisea aurea]|uniref:Nucleolar protein 14 n=1 Tax=Genlisea aurea TaxID=192259 RepID=S8D171_9LAMI|nr:hypothetical protein M569_03678 [Genlisea aurea]
MLIALQEERQKRMATTEDSDDEGSDAGYEKDDGSRVRPISGDDDPGILVSDKSLSRAKVVWIDDILTRENHKDAAENDTGSEQSSESGGDNVDSEEEEDDNDEDESDGVGDVPSAKDWEQSDDEYAEDDFNEEEEAAVVQRNECKVPDRVKPNSGQLQSELPFTIEAPKSFEEFSALLENRSDDQIVEAIKRIRAFNAISIAVENRKKMQVFYGILLQYFAVLASKKPLNLLLLNMIVKPLMEMSAEVPYFAAICARQRLLHTRSQFFEILKSTAQSCWPNLKTICLMRLWCMIFPCSDFRHAVMTPLLLLISEYLMRYPISSGRDIAVGSFLCSLMLTVSRQSKRFFPEALTFIQSMLVTALNDEQVIKSSKLYHLMELKTSGPVLRLQRRGADEIHPFDFFTLMDLPDDSPYFASDDFKISMVAALVQQLREYVEVYRSLKSFPEIFSPVSKTLQRLVNDDLLPEKLRAGIEEACRLIEQKSRETHTERRPLRYQKVKILKTFAPKFEESFVKGRDYDPDRDRAERRKLKKRLKQEAKGAARELRKDNQFLLEVKERERAEREEEKAERFGKFKAFLQEQEHAFRSGQLGKGKKRSRR